ncbi:MAG: glycosyltransferase family 4 protein [Sphaerochaetaceae bacterium]|nr:glycosyltransferase family 4 protein [Sphaerochaetaceae bacterium]
MHVLILSNLMSYTYNFRKELIDALVSRGDCVTVVCEDDDSDKRKEIEKTCSFINVPFNGKGKNPLEELKLIKTYRGIIRRAKPDFVLSFTIKMNLYGGLCLKNSGIPWIPMITGLGELEKEGRLRTVLLALHRLVMPHAKCVLFQNEDNLNFFKKNNIRINKGIIVPGSGINLSKYALQEYPQGNKTVFAFIGRLTEAKGIREFLEAAKRLAGDKLCFVAAGKCDDEFAPLVNSLVSEGKLDYLGMVGDSREVLKKCSCLVLPTYHPEGMSNVLLEACATGRPAICTDRTGCREIIKDQVNGLYCREKDTDNLCSVISDFVSLDYERRRAMGLAGRSLVEKCFDRSIIVETYLENIK